MDIAGNGNTIVVGAYQAPFDTGSGTGPGSVYVFTGSRSSWTQQATLLGHTAGDQFGSRVEISDDGNTIMVGADKAPYNSMQIQN